MKWLIALSVNCVDDSSQTQEIVNRFQVSVDDSTM
jgi:hypothetical protein